MKTNKSFANAVDQDMLKKTNAFSQFPLCLCEAKIDGIKHWKQLSFSVLKLYRKFVEFVKLFCHQYL